MLANLAQPSGGSFLQTALGPQVAVDALAEFVQCVCLCLRKLLNRLIRCNCDWVAEKSRCRSCRDCLKSGYHRLRIAKVDHVFGRLLGLVLLAPALLSGIPAFGSH